MNLRPLLPLAIVGFGAFAGCTCDKRKSGTDPAPAVPSAPAEEPAAAAPVDAARALLSDAERRALAKCPTTVFPARVEVTDVPDGVVVLVTSLDEGAVKDIRARAALVASARTEAGDDLLFRRCPVALPGATIGVRDVDAGVELTLRATKAGGVSELRAEVRAREDAVASGF